jgi:hypothetical protein
MAMSKFLISNRAAAGAAGKADLDRLIGEINRGAVPGRVERSIAGPGGTVTWVVWMPPETAQKQQTRFSQTLIIELDQSLPS